MWHLKHSAGWNPVGPTNIWDLKQLGMDAPGMK